MTESGMWKSLQRYLRLHESDSAFWRLETSGLPGIPDLVFRTSRKSGVIEMKYRKEWPKRPTTRLRANLSDFQVLRLQEWAGNDENGPKGDAYVLFGVDDEWFLLPFEKWHKKGFTQAEMRQNFLNGRIRGKKWAPLVEYLGK